MTEPWWEPAQALADAEVIALTAALLLALRQPGLHIPLPILAAFLFGQDQLGATALLRSTVETILGPALTEALRPAVTSVFSQIPRLALPALALPLPRMPPVEARPGVLEAYLAARVAVLLTTTTAALPQIVRQALRSELPIQNQVQEIVAQVGLTECQAQTVARYREGLEETDIASGQIATRVTRRAQTLLAQRAQVIAETELMTAVNTGARLALQGAAEAGQVQGQAVRRFWRVTDAMACKECQAIARRHAEGVGLDEPFQGPDGPLMGPPLHPSCRCLEDYALLP